MAESKDLDDNVVMLMFFFHAGGHESRTSCL